MIKSYKDLIVWQKSVDLVKEVYKATKNFPKSEIFTIIPQIQRAAISVPSNIAEGSARYGSKEFAQFLRISLGSLAELDTQLIISLDLKYLSDEQYLTISGKILEIKKMIYSIINKIGKIQ